MQVETLCCLIYRLPHFFTCKSNTFFTILSTTENSPIKVHVYIKVDTNSRRTLSILSDFSLTIKAAPHECVIRTGQP